eukprot:2222512-Pleurochrysis_carterae.AAC.1
MSSPRLNPCIHACEIARSRRAHGARVSPRRAAAAAASKEAVPAAQAALRPQQPAAPRHSTRRGKRGSGTPTTEAARTPAPRLTTRACRARRH